MSEELKTKRSGNKRNDSEIRDCSELDESDLEEYPSYISFFKADTGPLGACSDSDDVDFPECKEYKGTEKECDLLCIDIDVDSSGTDDEHLGYFCAMCKMVFDTFTQLNKHLESKRHKAICEPEKPERFKEDKSESDSSSSHGGIFDKPTDEKEWVQKNLCLKHGFGFDCSGCPEEEPLTEIEEKKKKIHKMAEEAFEEYQEDGNKDRMSDTTDMSALRQKIGDPFQRWGDTYGPAPSSSDSDDSEGEILWNRLYPKPDRKEWLKQNKSITADIQRLPRVQKLSDVPTVEGEKVTHYHDGWCSFEKREANNDITIRICEVEALKPEKETKCTCNKDYS